MLVWFWERHNRGKTKATELNAKSFAHLWVELYCHLQESSILQQRTTANLREWSSISTPTPGLFTFNLKKSQFNLQFFLFNHLLAQKQELWTQKCCVKCQGDKTHCPDWSCCPPLAHIQARSYTAQAEPLEHGSPSSREQQRANWGSSFGRSKEYANHQPSAK